MRTSISLLAITALFSVGNMFAGPITLTLSGTYGTITNTVPPSATTPFNNGSSFSFSVTLPSTVPFFSDSFRSLLHTDGKGTYTNGSVTVNATNQLTCQFQSCGVVALIDPAQASGENFDFAFDHLYTPLDDFNFVFDGPKLWTGPNNAPVINTGTFQLTQDPNLNFVASYSDGTNQGSATANAAMIGNATLVISQATPEPATFAFMGIGLLALVALRYRIARTQTPRNHL
jgi:hypothetical protein